MSLLQILGATATIDATATTGSVAVNAKVDTVRVYNAGTNDAFIAFGGSAVEAAVTDFPVPANTTVNISKGKSSHVAAICAATETATLYFTPIAGG